MPAAIKENGLNTPPTGRRCGWTGNWRALPQPLGVSGTPPKVLTLKEAEELHRKITMFPSQMLVN